MKKTIGLIIFTALVSLSACTKDNDGATNDTVAQDGEKGKVKDWYNTTFKNSKEWKQNSQSLNKVPDWSKGANLKQDSLDVFEFPLKEDYAKITILKNKSTTSKQAKKILDATVTRMVIIKTDANNMTVRKLYYVPEYNYLVSKNYDINNVMFGKTDDDFTGLLITKNWNDDVLFYCNVKNGKIESALVKQDANAPKKPSTAKVVNELDEVVVMNHYQQRDYVYTVPPPSVYYSPPTAPTNPYGTGGGSGYNGGTSAGSAPATNKTECQNAVDRLIDLSSPTSQLISVTAVSQSNNQIVNNYKWKIFSGPGYSLYSSDTGTLKKVANSNPTLQKEFVSLTHNSVYKEGTVVGGDISFSTIYAQPTLGKYNSLMALNYNVKFNTSFNGCPASYEHNYSSQKTFSNND